MKNLAKQGIKDLIGQFPQAGEILNEYGIGCVTCTVGTCLLKDIVKFHNLTPQQELAMMSEIAAVAGRTNPSRERERADQPTSHGESPVRSLTVAAPTEARPQPAKLCPPLGQLVDEHKWILRLAALLPVWAERVNPADETDRATTLEIVDFIRNFADRYHHAKEEKILFTYFNAQSQIIQSMNSDHETARSHVSAILAGLDARDASAIREHMAAYAALLQEHIQKEDQVLYPWMNRTLTDKQVGELFTRFAQVETEFGNVPAACKALVTRLEALLTPITQEA